MYLTIDTPGGGENRVPRSARFPAFVGMPADRPSRLDRLGVNLIGCGAVGRHIALHLARLNIGHLWLADNKCYKAESLLTQPITPAEIGQQKSLATARLCKQISPRTTVRYLADRVQAAGWGELAQADLVVLATDNLAVEVEVGQVCFRLGIPLLTAAVHGETLVAQAKWFAHRGSDDPCVSCLMGSWEQAALNEQVRFSCEGDALGQAGQPTRSVSCLCSLAADLAVTQILRSVLGLGRDVGNLMVEHCGINHGLVVAPLARRASCPEDHHLLRRVRVRRALEELTFADVMRLARVVRGEPGVSLVAGDFEWVQAAVCACPTPQSINRFVARDTAVVGRCRRCRQALRRGSFYSHGSVPADLLRPFARVPLGSLGAEAAQWLMVRRMGEGAWISTQRRQNND